MGFVKDLTLIGIIRTKLYSFHIICWSVCAAMVDPLTILAVFLVLVGWLGSLLDGECFTSLVDLTGTMLISQASGFRILIIKPKKRKRFCGH